jgi:hypothetical protein
MATGLVIVGIGILLIIIGFSTSHMEFVPGTLRRIEVPGAPTPAAWIIFIVGLVMSAAGFGKRVLASIEK